MEEVIYRDFEDNDREWVLAALVESMLATLTPDPGTATDREALKQGARADFDRFHYQAKKPDRVTLAWRDGQRVGMVWIAMGLPFRDEEHKAWLMEVYVVPEARGQGLAKGLLALAEAWAKAHGANEIWLNVGRGNDKALGLYGSGGYRVETMHLSKKL
jgi:GNAT superfamily N-acetyltransferase